MNNLRNRTLSHILFACLAAALLLTACMSSSTGSDAPDATPSASPSAAPETTVSNKNPFDWSVNTPEIENNLGRISEISEARVVVDGQTALVAVKFSPAYQGEMTPRIRQMIAGEIMKADSSIKTVAVTADEADVGKTYDLSDRLRAGEKIEAIKKDIEDIVRNITTRT